MERLRDRIRGSLGSLKEELFAFISVPHCPGCGAGLSDPGTPICNNCIHEFEFPGDGPVCLVCRGLAAIGCDCAETLGWCLPSLYYWGTYTDTMRLVIHEFKFRRRRKIGSFVASLAIDILLDRLRTVDVELIVPVPLAGADRRERGFNQTELISQEVSEALGVPVATRALRKVRKTKFQANLGAKERWQNVAGAFVADQQVTGVNVLLVDDIVTTGATCFECARALYYQGARQVTVLALVSNKDRQPTPQFD